MSTVRLARALAVALALAGPAALIAAPAAAEGVRLTAAHRAIEVSVGRPLMVETERPFKEIVVGDPAVADVSPLTDRSFIILGARAGLTGIALFDENKAPVGSADIEVSPHTDRLQAALAARIPGADIEVTSENGKVLLSGTADDASAIEEANAIASQFAGENVVNTMDVTNVQQVQLEVRFLEASRTAGRELGIKWNIQGGDISAGVGSALLPSLAAPFGTLMGQLIGNGVQVDFLINALEQKGLARRLAEPNLVAMSGETASFLAGGEFPFPVSTKEGIVVEFKKFGVGLDFTPTVGPDDVIHMVIKPEVSQIDPGLSIKVGDSVIPSITVRRATTTVELRDGQSFVIGGLLQSTNSVTQDKVPWMGDVPVLGALFRSNAYKKQETDLVIIVTPHLVRPLDPGQTVATPLDHTSPASDVDLFLGGKAEVAAAGALSYAASAAPGAPATGYILDLPEIR
jgi:pilus assembly protein CpaC